MSCCQRRRKTNFLRHICVWFVVLSLPFYGVFMAALWGEFISKPVKAVSFNSGESQNLQNPDFAVAKMAQMSLPFVPNRGQYDSQVRYSTQLFSGGVFFVTDNDLTYDFRGAESDGQQNLAIKESFLNTKSFKIIPEDQAPTVASFFKGSDPSKWQSGLKTYNTLSLGTLYPKVEVKLKAGNKNVEKVFYIAPGGNPLVIASKLTGIKSLKVANDGSLIVDTALGEIRQTKPVAYQNTKIGRKNVDVAYVLKDWNTYGFVVGDYDRRLLLVIDPAFAGLASTFLGGSNGDDGFAIALDASNNVYLVGRTSSSDFPATSGVYDTSHNGGPNDIFIAKLNSALTQLSAATFLGGSGDDNGQSIALDASGNIYLAGETASSNFPTTAGVADTTLGGSQDVFVAKLNNALTSLTASTYLGGSAIDYSKDGNGKLLALDGSNNIFVTGHTASSDFPTTGGAYDTTQNGSNDVFVAKLTNDLTSVSAATYLGDTGSEIGSSLALDGSNNIFITGSTNSASFPTTGGAYDTSINGSTDAFVAKFNNTLTALSASTFLGGASGSTQTRSVVIDSGSAVVTGFTNSSSFPTTIGVYDTTYNGVTDNDVFISKFSSDLTSLSASTFLGTSGVETANVARVDGSSNIYVFGVTRAADFPTTAGAYDTTRNGTQNLFISKFNSGLTSLSASTYLGSTGTDWAFSMALDSSNNPYLAGSAGASDFPTTSGVYDTSFNSGTSDVFIAVLSSPTVQFSATSGSGSEATTSVNIGLTLSAVTSSNVTVDYSVTGGTATGSGTDYTLAAGTATITAGSLTANISATIVNDNIDESDETIIVTISNAGNADLGSQTTHTYTIQDNDTAGVTVTESSGSTTVTEGGATDSYTVVLTSQPTANVTITPSPNAQVSVSPTTLIFTTANWNSAQTVTVTAVDDSNIEGNHTGSITHSASSSDTTYNGISIASVTPNITDNDRASGGSSPSNPIQNQFPPIGVTDLTGQALSATSVRWCFTDNANNENGFVLHGASENELGSAGASSSTGFQACITEENLSPNSQVVNRHIHAFNSMGMSPASETTPATWTLAVVSGTPTVSPIAKDKILIVVATDTNSSLTEYAIFENLQQKWVQAGGDLGVSPVWQTRAGWGGDNGIQAVGLTASTTYEFKIKTRNGAQIETGFSTATATKTLKGAPKLILHLTAKVISRTQTPAVVSYKGFWGFLRKILLAVVPDKALALISPVKAQVTTVQVGDQIQFTATVENTGDDAATNVVLTLPLPAGVIYNDGSMKVDGVSFSAELKDSVLTVVIAELGAGVKKTLEWGGTVVAQAAETGVVAFQAQVQATEVPAAVEPVKSEVVSFDVAPPDVPFTVTPSEVLVNQKDQIVEVTGPVGFKLTLCLSSDPSVVGAQLVDNKCQLQILKNGTALLEIQESGGHKATVKITVNIPPPPPICGNGKCESGEDYVKCVVDCPKPKIEEIVPPIKEEVPSAPVETPSEPTLPMFGEATAPVSQPAIGEGTSGTVSGIVGEVGVPGGSTAFGGGLSRGAAIFGPLLAPTLTSIALGKTDIALAEKILPSTAIVTITLRGYINDQDWLKGIKEGRVRIQSEVIERTFVPQKQNWSYTTSEELSFGQHQAQVAFIDQSGDVSPYSEPRSFEVKKPACGDGVDNDDDLQIDYPSDIGCESLIDNNEKNPLIVQIMAIPAVTQVVEAAKPVVEAVKPAVEVLDKKVLNNPAVEQVNETYAAPAVAVVAVANASTAVASTSLLSYLQLWLQYLQAVFSQPILLLFKRKRKGWGVIYNALTKLPMDLTTIRLVDAVNGRIVQTRVTDKIGRYAFFVSQPGAYRLEIAKTGFTFPTRYLKSKSVDLEWLGLYHGETIEVKTKGAVITRNIPVDPEEKIVVPEAVIKSRRKLRLQHGVSLAGFFFSIGSLAVSPTTLILTLLAIHIVTYFLFRRLSIGRRPKSWGVVFDAVTKKPLGLVVARIFETQYSKLLEAQITDGRGRYAFLVGPSQYYATFEKAGYQPVKTEVIDLTAPGKEAVVGMDVALNKLT